MDQNTLAMLNQSADISPLTDAAHKGMQLAQQAQDIEVSKQQAELQQQQVQAAKFNGAMGVVSTYGKMSPEAQRKFRPMVEKQAVGYGLDSYGPILDAMDSDPVLKSGMASLASDQDFLKASGLDLNSINSQLASNPLGATDQMHSLLQQRAEFYKNKSQMQNNIEVAKAKGAITLQGKQITADATVDAAKERAKAIQEVAKTRQGQVANNAYAKELSKPEGALFQANRANDLLEHISAQELKSTPAIASDLNGAVASLINGGKPATVYGMSHQELDSAWARLEKYKGFLSGDAVNTVTDDQLDQMHKDIQAISGNIAKQHENQFLSFIEGQPEATRELLVNRYDKFRKRQGLNGYDNQTAPPKESQAPGLPKEKSPVAPAALKAPTTAAEAQASFQGSFSPEQIKQYIQAKGLK